VRLKSLWLLLLSAAGICFSSFVRAADPGIDYLEPKVLAGSIYSDVNLKHVLFTFHRTATKSGSIVRVLREFNLPDGTIAARERVVYDSGELRSYSLEELQSGAKGSVVVQSTSGEAKINFDYSQDGTKKTGNEKRVPNILINDMVGPFIISHRDALMNGATVKCRLVALSRAETVGFKFFKEAESTWHGKPVLIVKLEPSSIIIARLVAPLHFIVEKDNPHHVLQYTGRTTPGILKNGKWEDLDATTVFNW
jgi:hypothetical protein